MTVISRDAAFFFVQGGPKNNFLKFVSLYMMT